MILWEIESANLPKDPAEQAKIFSMMAEITKKALDSGHIKDWGIFAGGGSGYSIVDEPPTDTLTRDMQLSPFVKLHINPVLGMAEVLKVMQSLQPK